MVSYWPSLPGFRLLPLSIRKIVYFKLLNGRLLRSLGGEILLFIKLVNNLPDSWLAMCSWIRADSICLYHHA